MTYPIPDCRTHRPQKGTSDHGKNTRLATGAALRVWLVAGVFAWAAIAIGATSIV